MERNDDEKIIKKRYLRSYRAHVHRQERLEEQLVELKAMKIYPSMRNNDGMPHGSSTDQDLSGYVAEKERLEKEIEKEKEKRVQSYAEIMEYINRLPRERERDVLFYRYIKDMDWWEVAKKMNYSQRETYRTHSTALRKLEIPESWQ